MRCPVWASWTDISFISTAFLWNPKFIYFFKKEAVPKKKHAWKCKNKIILGLQENQSLNISFTVFHDDQLCFDFLVLNIPVPIRKIIWGF